MDDARSVYLLLGDPQDSWCLALGDALVARHHTTLTIASPLADPSYFAWHLNDEESASRLVWDGEPPLTENDIGGVFVRTGAWIDPTNWQRDDLSYMISETQAALIAWLWSLTCPVINRYPAAVWYYPKAPLLLWHSLLRRCGLPTLETLITNVPQEAETLRLRLEKAGIAGVVYEPLTSSAGYLVTSEEDWSRLATMQGYAPACLPYPHGEVQSLCVVGDRVIWEGQPSSEAVKLEPALCRFAGAAGLAFIELAIARASAGLCVIAVEPYPQLEHFGQIAREQIVKNLTELLSAGRDRGREAVPQISKGASP